LSFSLTACPAAEQLVQAGSGWWTGSATQVWSGTAALLWLASWSVLCYWLPVGAAILPTAMITLCDMCCRI